MSVISIQKGVVERWADDVQDRSVRCDMSREFLRFSDCNKYILKLDGHKHRLVVDH